MAVTLPDIGGDTNTWGQELNDYILDLRAEADSALATAQSAASTAGSVSGLATAAQATANTALANAAAAQATANAAVASAAAPNDTSVNSIVTNVSSATHASIVAIAVANAVPTDVSGKADNSAVVHNTGAETIAGVKTFSSAPVIPDGTLTIAKTTGLQSALNLKSDASVVTALSSTVGAKADLSAVVALTGAQTVAGAKTFTSPPSVPDASFPTSKVTGLDTALTLLAPSTAVALKATDTTVVHNTGAETVAGVKTFSSAPVVPAGSFPESAVVNLTTDLAGKALASDLATLTTTVAGKVTQTNYNHMNVLIRNFGVTSIPGDFPSGLVFTKTS